MRISQDEIPRFGTNHACFLVFLILVLIQIIFAHTAKAAEVCVLAAAQVISVEGIVEFRKSRENAWHQVELSTYANFSPFIILANELNPNSH